MNYSQDANPNATNSELDAKVIIDHNDDSRFIEQIYEIAFGDDAINRNFSHDEVIEQIREFSDHALNWEMLPHEEIEELGLDVNDLHNISEEMEKSYRQGYADGKNFNADDVAKCIVDTNGDYAECVDHLVNTMEGGK